MCVQSPLHIGALWSSVKAPGALQSPYKEGSSLTSDIEGFCKTPRDFVKHPPHLQENKAKVCVCVCIFYGHSVALERSRAITRLFIHQYATRHLFLLCIQIHIYQSEISDINMFLFLFFFFLPLIGAQIPIWLYSNFDARIEKKCPINMYWLSIQLTGLLLGGM